jgi:hypothetical protein
MAMAFEDAWPFTPLGDLPAADRAAFYADLETPTAGIFGSGNADAWESQFFRWGLLNEATGRFTIASEPQPDRRIENATVNVYMSRFFAAQMPGQRFKLQLYLGSQHAFDGDNSEVVGHAYAVEGRTGDYVNLLNEPVFRRLRVSDLLKIRVGITFVSDRTTDSILASLESDAVRRGIELTTVYNPVFGAAAAYVKAVTAAILNSKKNQVIIKCDATLSSKPGATDPMLCEGTYLLIQVPASKRDTLDWTRLRWDGKTERVLEVAQPLDWNHLLLRIEKVPTDTPEQAQ